MLTLNNSKAYLYISLIRDVWDVSRLFGSNSGLISSDQQKAIDRVEHQLLWHTFQPSGFTAVIRVLCEDIESIFKVNGALSALFKVRTGIRQGGSLSGMLYSIALEPF